MSTRLVPGITALVLLVCTVPLFSQSKLVIPKSVDGRVTDEAGQPIAEALIVMSYYSGSPPVLRDLRNSTDDQGRFQISLPAEIIQSTNLSAPGWIYKPGFNVERFKPSKALYEEMHYYEITLRPESQTVFRVLNPDGTPFQGTVSPDHQAIGDQRYQSMTGYLSDILAGHTDDTGTVVIHGVDRSRLASILIRETDGATQRMWVFEDFPQTTTRTINLEPTGSVEIEFDVAGDFKSNLEARFWMRPTYKHEPKSTPDPRTYSAISETVRVSEKTTFAKVTHGEYKIWALLPENSPYLTDISSPVQISEGKNTRFVIPLVKAVRVTGRIIDAGTGSPIPYARLSFQRNGDSFGGQSNKNGEYTVKTLPGMVYVNVTSLADSGFQIKEYSRFMVRIPQQDEFQMETIVVETTQR